MQYNTYREAKVSKRPPVGRTVCTSPLVSGRSATSAGTRVYKVDHSKRHRLAVWRRVAWLVPIPPQGKVQGSPSTDEFHYSLCPLLIVNPYPKVDGEERRLSCRPPCEFRRLLSRIPFCSCASSLFCLRIHLLVRALYHIHPCIFSFPPSTSLAIRILTSACACLIRRICCSRPR
jgi:hypothetical protein